MTTYFSAKCRDASDESSLGGDLHPAEILPSEAQYFILHVDDSYQYAAPFSGVVASKDGKRVEVSHGCLSISTQQNTIIPTAKKKCARENISKLVSQHTR